MPAFGALMDELLADPAVTPGKMFGHDGARLGKKFFAMEFDGDFVLRLGDERLAELESAGKAGPFEPMAGRKMGGWARVSGDGDNLPELVALAEEAKAFLAASL